MLEHELIKKLIKRKKMMLHLGKGDCEILRWYFLFLTSSAWVLALNLMVRTECDHGFTFHVFSMLQHH